MDRLIQAQILENCLLGFIRQAVGTVAVIGFHRQEAHQQEDDHKHEKQRNERSSQAPQNVFNEFQSLHLTFGFVVLRACVCARAAGQTAFRPSNTIFKRGCLKHGSLPAKPSRVCRHETGQPLPLAPSPDACAAAFAAAQAGAMHLKCPVRLSSQCQRPCPVRRARQASLRAPAARLHTLHSIPRC